MQFHRPPVNLLPDTDYLESAVEAWELRIAEAMHKQISTPEDIPTRPKRNFGKRSLRNAELRLAWEARKDQKQTIPQWVAEYNANPKHKRKITENNVEDGKKVLDAQKL